MRKKLLFIIPAAAVLLVGVLWGTGLVSFAVPDPTKYKVYGIDISHHQGDIDWDAVARSGVSFAYIKATEGERYTDPLFEQNFRAAREAGILTGAYHFFRFDAGGAQQARHFLDCLPKADGMLLPAVDVEFAGNSGDYDADTVAEELKKYIEVIRKNVKFDPVIYVLRDSYERFIKGRFEGIPLWMRDTVFEPGQMNGARLVLWQYSGSGSVKGVRGPVDLDVFMGEDGLSGLICNTKPDD